MKSKIIWTIIILTNYAQIMETNLREISIIFQRKKEMLGTIAIENCKKIIRL